MFRILNHFNELLFLHTSLALDTAVKQDTLELLNAQLRNILLFHVFRLHRKFHGANFTIRLIDTFAQPIIRHAERKRVRYVSLDGVDVIADLTFPGR